MPATTLDVYESAPKNQTKYCLRRTLKVTFYLIVKYTDIKFLPQENIKEKEEYLHEDVYFSELRHT